MRQGKYPAGIMLASIRYRKERDHQTDGLCGDFPVLAWQAAVCLK